MKKYFLLLLAIAVSLTSTSQLTTQRATYKHALSASRTGTDPNSGPQVTSSGQSGTGANIDVLYHKAFWRINPDSFNSSSVLAKFLSGYVKTNFRTTTSNVTQISFDLHSTFTIDSVRFRGAKLPGANVTRSGNIVTIVLGATLANNFIDSLWIHYKGVPPAVSGSAEGYQQGQDALTGQNFIYTLAESYEDRDWWPCKADMQDKIDSMDIVVNVPWSGADTFWVATNGKLVDSAISGGSRTFTFKTRYPMASYLVSVCVGRFNRYYRAPVNINGTYVPYVVYAMRGKTAGTYTTILNAADINAQVMSAFSTKFGDYPYKREKAGFYEGLAGAGGMEHQTFSAIAANAMSSHSVLAHELMHQWFGDKASCATWADLWLAEGFARYSEALAGELVPATGLDPVAERGAAKTSARTVTTTPTRITSFANSNAVWSSNNVKAVYDRGCMVVSMLRALSGDTYFFQACRNYLDSANGSGYKSATSDSLKNNFNNVVGFDFTPFFNDWVLGTGHPTTVVNWNTPVANKLVLKVASQTRSGSSSVSYFHNVIVVRAQGSLPSQDTLIVFYDVNGNNHHKAGNGFGPTTTGGLGYTLSFTPTTVTFDPYNMTMSAGSTAKVTTLDLKIVDFNAKNSGSYNEAFLTLDDNSINSDIILEKSSDAVSFSTAGNMSLQQNGGTVKHYYFKDANPMSVTYYRAKYRGIAGEFIYSKIIKVISGNKGKFSIINNPATSVLRINASASTGKSYQFEIFDAEGKLVVSENKAVLNSVITINISRMAKGTYMVKITDGNEAESLKFVVE